MNPPTSNTLPEHLFRRKYAEILAALLRMIGYENFDVAEEAVQTAFHRTLEKWQFPGVPENPAGWLFQVARNAALESLRRRSLEQTKLQQLRVEEETVWDDDSDHQDYQLDDLASTQGMRQVAV